MNLSIYVQINTSKGQCTWEGVLELLNCGFSLERTQDSEFLWFQLQQVLQVWGPHVEPPHLWLLEIPFRYDYRCLEKLPQFLGERGLRIGILCACKRLTNLFTYVQHPSCLYTQSRHFQSHQMSLSSPVKFEKTESGEAQEMISIEASTHKNIQLGLQIQISKSNFERYTLP